MIEHAFLCLKSKDRPAESPTGMIKTRMNVR